MKLPILYKKKWRILLIVCGLLMALVLVQKTYAGKPVISLNSPASFPVDI
ncbi:hypothetical protein SPBRAN_1184 [uncultured Candidatus Thioglobus sp.]|nr:hypothetical protein SPBRAN_1184 [uncultured Candidatus Thioglobus sp.]